MFNFNSARSVIERIIVQALRMFDLVATFPRRGAMIWSGKRSILASIVFTSIFLARLLSPLQWHKYIVRRRASVSATDGPQQRADFHAARTEWYFIWILAFLGLLSFLLTLLAELPPQMAASFLVVAKVVAWPLFIESLVWVLYYGSMRGFIERDYNIYHRAEYLLAMPVVFCVAVTAFTVISGKSFWACTALFFDHGEQFGFSDQQLLLGHASFVLFFVVTVTYLVAQFPQAHIKSETRPDADITVIGAGDVVANRILPALLKSKIPNASISILTERVAPGYEYRFRKYDVPVKIISNNTGIASEVQRCRAPVLIATSTGSHLSLLKAILQENKNAEALTSRVRLAIEKPLIGPGELGGFLKVLKDYGRGNVFALSYYYQEKGLALVYLLTREPSYESYLLLPPVGRSALRTLIRNLGSLERISGAILEGAERSPLDKNRMWILDPAQGGIAYEMLVHLLMLTQVCLAELSGNKLSLLTLDMVEVSNAISRNAPPPILNMQWPTALSLTGKAKEVDVELVCGKYVPQQYRCRKLVIKLKNGQISCDFDDQSVCITDSVGQRITSLQLRSEFADLRYSVIIDLARKFFARGFWAWTRNDGLAAQLCALKWLATHSRRVNDTSRLVDYDELQVPKWMEGFACSNEMEGTSFNPSVQSESSP
jgi:hypothetical protein